MIRCGSQIAGGSFSDAAGELFGERIFYSRTYRLGCFQCSLYAYSCDQILYLEPHTDIASLEWVFPPLILLRIVLAHNTLFHLLPVLLI